MKWNPVTTFYNFRNPIFYRSSAECLQKYAELIDLDICSPTFDASRATHTIMEHSERLICDVILDQLVLPGVGNIIKNEVSVFLFANYVIDLEKLSSVM